MTRSPLFLLALLSLAPACIGDPPPGPDLGAAGAAGASGVAGTSGSSGQGGSAAGAAGQGGGGSGGSGQAGSGGSGGSGQAGAGGSEAGAGGSDAGAGGSDAGAGGSDAGAGGSDAGAGGSDAGAGGDAGAAGDGGAGGGAGAGGEGGSVVAGAGGDSGAGGAAGGGGEGGAGAAGVSGSSGQSGAGGSAGAAGSCSGGLTACGGGCVDTLRDEANCGGCGEVCANVCIAGKCHQVVEVKAGALHACARLATGKLICWGDSTYGELGLGESTVIGDDERPSEPTHLSNQAEPLKSVSVGYQSTCAIGQGDQLYCWGDNSYGQLGLGIDISSIGDDQDADAYGPVPLEQDVGVLQVQTGSKYTCALLSTGAVRCWGENIYGTLGNPDNKADSIGRYETIDDPSFNVDLSAKVKQISLGECHVCAVLDKPNEGQLNCWGCNNSGQLGRGNTSYVGATQTPESVGSVDLGGRPVKQVVAFGNSTCALLDQNEVRCWGDNGSGQLGYGKPSSVNYGATSATIPAKLAAVKITADPLAKVVQLAGGYDHICARLDTGAVHCWGSNSNGKLGYGNTDDVGSLPATTPAAVGPIDLGGEALQIATGYQFTCALLASDNVRCWGLASGGRLGFPKKGSVLSPGASEDVF